MMVTKLLGYPWWPQHGPVVTSLDLLFLGLWPTQSTNTTSPYPVSKFQGCGGGEGKGREDGEGGGEGAGEGRGRGGRMEREGREQGRGGRMEEEGEGREQGRGGTVMLQDIGCDPTTLIPMHPFYYFALRLSCLTFHKGYRVQI